LLKANKKNGCALYKKPGALTKITVIALNLGSLEKAVSPNLPS